MDTSAAEGFFPEREALRARRLRALLDQPVNPAEIRNQRAGIWVVLWVAVFLPMFVNAISFGWHGRITPRSMEVIKYSLGLLLVVCGVCVAVGIWRSIHRSPRSAKDMQCARIISAEDSNSECHQTLAP